VSALKHQLRPILLRLSSSSSAEAAPSEQGWEYLNMQQAPDLSAVTPSVTIITPGLSHISSKITEPLVDLPVGKMAERSANKYSGRTAVLSVHENRSINFADLLEQVKSSYQAMPTDFLEALLEADI